MFSTLSSWWLWLGLGGTAGAFILLLLAARFAGLNTFVSAVGDAVSPILVSTGTAIGGAIGDVWSEYRAGLRDISKTVAALFALVVTSLVVAAFVYFPTKHVAVKQAEVRVWKQAHSRYRLLPKPRANSTPLDAVRKSLGGLF